MNPKAIVTAFLTAMERMDYDAALKCVSSDCEYTNLPMGTVTGSEGIRGVLEPFFAPIAENEFKLLRMAVEGDVVFVERLDRHRVGDKWFELPVAGVFEVRDGRITVWREYFDLGTLQRGLA
ncbi:limonene-1,2-epoxide hydrolase family protein [Vitreimonas flagellata]|uniref:limonene-1,2-epoxide hydrolase family protein n=1 Tax=Vitreimonas flagellata TaxID=2560861 RepID=UPI0010755CEC|nr:limonene-1,2-epoxide hydrolase family protein [Vitreimonas flagellata]